MSPPDPKGKHRFGRRDAWKGLAVATRAKPDQTNQTGPEEGEQSSGVAALSPTAPRRSPVGGCRRRKERE